LTIGSILQAPSRSEYSLWTCRWTDAWLTQPSFQSARTPHEAESASSGHSLRAIVGLAMIYFLRHGDAEPGDGDDAARALSEKGERQARDAGRALAAIGASVDVCLTSPRVRAERTARIACEELAAEVEIEVAEKLAGGRFDALELAAGRGDVLLVGHEPDFSAAVAELTSARVKMRKGGIACVQDGTLQALLRPKDLRAIAAD
jgi:phosphohistidine phosphatase